MPERRGRVLVVDNPERTVIHALRAALAGHDVEVVCDALEAIYRIDCAEGSHDVVFCDLECDQLSGPELWTFLAQRRGRVAERMVFVASSPPRPETHAFLARVPNPWIHLPADAKAIDALVTRRCSAGVSNRVTTPPTRRVRSG
jgi:CheY-like chemotaxis protein